MNTRMDTDTYIYERTHQRRTQLLLRTPRCRLPAAAQTTTVFSPKNTTTNNKSLRSTRSRFTQAYASKQTVLQFPNPELLTAFQDLHPVNPSWLVDQTLRPAHRYILFLYIARRGQQTVFCRRTQPTAGRFPGKLG